MPMKQSHKQLRCIRARDSLFQLEEEDRDNYVAREISLLGTNLNGLEVDYYTRCVIYETCCDSNYLCQAFFN